MGYTTPYRHSNRIFRYRRQNLNRSKHLNFERNNFETCESLAPQPFIVMVTALMAFLLLACSAQAGTGAATAQATRPGAIVAPMASPSPSAPAAARPAAALLKPLPLDTPVPVTVDHLNDLSTEEQLASVIAPTRDLRDLALRLDPARNDIPIVVNRTTPHYAVGDKLSFWVHDLEANSNIQITATLIYKTNVAYVWVEDGQPYDHDAIVRSIDRFSQQSYPAERALFGSEWKPGVDDDPRLHILHATGLGGGIAGYYSSADEYSRLARGFSNEKEMFYINLAWLNSSRNYNYYETVLAHEFQHMIHWHQDRNEDTWVNEGMSEFAQEVAGYPPDNVFTNAFDAKPDTQLDTWSENQQGNGVHYGAAYLFMTYFSQRFGRDLVQAVVANPANGIDGFNDALDAAGLGKSAASRFDGIFADWVAANYVNDPNALALDGVYGYRNIQKKATPALDQTYSQYPTPIRRSSVHNYATDYVSLKGTGNVEMQFSGQSDTQLANLTIHNGQQAWWSNRGDDFDTRLTRQFDLRHVSPNIPVQMNASMWWDIEANYDYGYVLVSRDGQKWDILQSEHTTTQNQGGNGFGPGYTGESGANGEAPQWVIEHFDLSPYIGSEIQVRFEYVTDDAIDGSGWFLDKIAVPALGYASDFEHGNDGWQSEGWLLTDNHLTQRWLLQVLSFQDKQLTAVQRFPVDATGHAQVDINGLGNGKTAVLAISALAPVTTEPAKYEFEIVPK